MPSVFQECHIVCATQEISIPASATPAGNKHAPTHPKLLLHCPYLQITLWGSLARACANLLAMSSDRYFTPAPKETRTKPFS